MTSQSQITPSPKPKSPLTDAVLCAEKKRARNLNALFCFVHIMQGVYLITNILVCSVVFVPAFHLLGPRFESWTGALHVNVDKIDMHMFSQPAMQLSSSNKEEMEMVFFSFLWYCFEKKKSKSADQLKNCMPVSTAQTM